MLLVTVSQPGEGRRLGLVAGAAVIDLTGADPFLLSSFETLLAAADAAGCHPSQLIAPHAERAPRWTLAELDREPGSSAPCLDKPFDPAEVWAAGVTYERSRDAREAESGGATVYDRVYAAERPELFFKATGRRAVGPNHPVGIRGDSDWQVPEPEVAVVLGTGGSVIGYTLCNDMSSRDIEGANPLYLPQAKIFRWSCAFGPGVLLAPPNGAHPVFPIRLRILRNGQTVVAGETSTARLKRTYEELAGFLLRDNEFFPPTLLSTGTGVVPPDDFTLAEGDLIEIEADGIGILRNRVVKLS